MYEKYMKPVMDDTSVKIPKKVYDVLKHGELCIVLGLGTQAGLSIVRCLGRQGVRIIGLDKRNMPMGRVSRYCDHFISYQSPDNLLGILTELGRSLDRKLPVIVSSDSLAIFMDEHRDLLAEHYLFNWQSKRRISEIINKHDMLRLAHEAGIDTPHTWHSDRVTLEQLRQEIVYPAFIKPPYTTGTKKGVIVRSLLELDEALKNDLFQNGFIAQEYLEGPETNIVFAGTYSGRDGSLIASSCGRKIRQLPSNIGISTCVQDYHDDEVTHQAALFLKHVGYYGIADIEFKKSIVDGRYKFIEINPRVSGWNEFCMARGLNLPYVCYLDLLERLDDPDALNRDISCIKWISFLDDLHTFFRFYFPKRPSAIAGWFRDIATADVDAVFSLQDPLPFLIAAAELIGKASNFSTVQAISGVMNRPPLHIVLQKEEVAIVLGAGNQTGLSILRSLGRQGVRVIGLSHEYLPMARVSRYCDYFIRYHSQQHMEEILEGLGGLFDRKLPLFVSTDALAIFMDDHHDQLSPYFLFHWQQQTSYREIIEKHSMQRLARRAGLNVPLTFSSEDTPVDQIAKRAVFPCMVKPLLTVTGFKGVLVRSSYELASALKADVFSNGYIVQEYIPGPETSIAVVGTYTNRDAKLQAESCGRKIRQLPKGMGIATYLHTAHDQEVVSAAAVLLKEIGFFGIADIEFKRSEADGRLRFIEINPRPSGINEFYYASGIDLVHMGYQDLLGRLDPGLHRAGRGAGVRWISLLDDINTVVRYYLPQDVLILPAWISDMISADAYAVFAKDDPLPFLPALGDNLYKAFRSMKKLLPMPRKKGTAS